MAKKSRSGSSNTPRQRPSTPSRTQPAQEPVAAVRRDRRSGSMQNRKEERLKLQQTQKRQWLYTRVAFGVILVALIGWFGYIGFQAYQGYQIRGDVDEYFGKDDFVAEHYDTGAVLYEQIPPTGGFHNAAWQNCGFYDQYLNNVNAVHSLEHGAVWITYDPALPESDIESLREMGGQPYMLVSPYPGMGSPITLSIWGHQLKLDSFDEGKIDAFVREYKVKQEYTPEFGAICYGGTSATTDVEPQQQPFIIADPSLGPVGGIRDIDATATAAALNPVPTPTVE
ncbi:MAG: DUF3105 domain-containing protein, partial [Thermomicrobiales bacterium]